jgi:asparagine synthase (glutamine-hydrolysing)
VFAARDPLGVRRLAFHQSPDRLIVASEEAAVLAMGVDARPDEASLVAHCAVRPFAPGATAFAAIRELPAGHRILWRRDGVGELTRRGRSFLPERILRPGRDGERAEELREVLDRAVACRLRTPPGATQPGVLLSGGLDSSMVAAAAAGELHRRGAGPLTTVSWVFETPELAGCDESRWIGQIADRLDACSRTFAGDGHLPLARLGDEPWPRNPSTPLENPYRALKVEAYARAREAGCRSLLTGAYGDHLYGGGGRWLMEDLRAGRVVRAAGLLAAGLARRGVREPGLRHLARSFLGRGRPRLAPSWLTPEARALLPPEETLTVPSTLRPEQVASLVASLSARTVAVESFHAARAGLDLRHPFRDLRLVRFFLSLPADQLLRHGRWKQIARVAGRGRLPVSVLARDEPTSLLPFFRRGLARERARVDRLLERPDALWRRYVTADGLARGFEFLAEGTDGPHTVLPWQCSSLELWSLAAFMCAGDAPASEVHGSSTDAEAL